MYVISSYEEKVDAGKVYEKGFETRATGGNCELRGYATIGFECARLIKLLTTMRSSKTHIFAVERE